MEHSTKKRVTGALVAPVLSLTILCAGSDAGSAENLNIFNKIFLTNKAKTSKAGSASDEISPRLVQLEQAVRDLTVQVETLQFTVLQMQNRLDVLEGKTPSHPSIEESVQLQAQAVAKPPSEAPQAAAMDEKEMGAQVTHIADSMQIFGSVHFDGNGNLLENILPETKNPQEFYKVGYRYILAGDYPAAEQIFRAFQIRFPDDEQLADASFWLGEALYAQGKYREAAQVYIDVQRNHENSPHGPENLLKLGLSMAQLQETEVACKTLTEVPKRYDKAEPAVIKRVNDEKRRLGCS